MGGVPETQRSRSGDGGSAVASAAGDTPRRRGRGVAVAAALAVLALLALAALFFRFQVLYDTDSYFHLAIARAYAKVGQIEELPWARFSLMRDGFGDKELLFHWLLAPFAAGEQATAGGRWALAGLNAAVVLALALLGMRAVGRWGAIAPLMVYLGSSEFFGRIVRLRPELLALLLLLAALACAGRRRYRLLGVVALVFTLSYTAFHALLILCLAWFLQQGWVRRRWEWPLLLYPWLGAGLGLLVHPHFPHNLLIWKVQTVDFFRLKDALDVGTEIGAGRTDDLVWGHLGWLLLVAVVWRSAGPGKRAGDTTMADFATVGAVAFGLLHLLARRFSIYLVPFAVLAVLFELARRGLGVGPRTRLPGRGSLPTLACLVLVGAVGAVPVVSQIRTLSVGAPGALSREQEWSAFGRAVPPGARVAAEWGSAHLYLFFAPQALYLNVLDPIFMALPYPESYAAQRRLFSDREPDIPLVLVQDLASDHLALSRLHQPQALLARLAAEPRLETRYAGYTLLFALAERPPGFLLYWRLAPEGGVPPVADPARLAGWPTYPRAERAEARAVEGFVDLDRFGRDAAVDCRTVATELAPGEAVGAAREALELAPWGPTAAWLDGELLLATDDSLRATPGRGLRIELPRASAGGILTVLSCREPETGRIGFSVRRLREGAAGNESVV